MVKNEALGPDQDRRGLRSDVALAPLTSLELGGAARYLAEIDDVRDAIEAIRWASGRREPITVLGGGSNVVVADDGFRGLVLRAAMHGIDSRRDHDSVLVTAGAGENWDDLVADTVDRDLAGIECLSGIPGQVGATPIQNVGAYGQEVADVVEGVRVLDLETLEEHRLSAEDCDFDYRNSVFRARPGRFLVLAVTFRLHPGGEPALRYKELERAMSIRYSSPTVADVREVVLELRRSKSMVLDLSDPNRRSAGSFFVNPVIGIEGLSAVSQCGRATGVLQGDEQVPSFDIGGGHFKMSAGWLIEKAGFHKGIRRGLVGISSAHALALVNHGGGTAADLVALAREIRDGVQRVFGIELRPEPVFLGFESENPLNG